MTVAGSPKYFSPELDAAFSRHEETANFNAFKSDVFSFGLILLELGTLKVPKRDSDIEVWKKFIEEGIDGFCKIYEELVKDDQKEKKQLELLVGMIRKCLRINPGKRPDFLNLYFKFQERFRMVDYDIVRTQIIMGENINNLWGFERNEIKSIRNKFEKSEDEISSLKKNLKKTSLELYSFKYHLNLCPNPDQIAKKTLKNSNPNPYDLILNIDSHILSKWLGNH